MNQRTKGYVILAIVTTLIGGVIGLGTALFVTSPDVARASTVYEAAAGAVGPDAFSPSYATGQLPQSYEFEFESGQIAASSESLYIQPRGTYGGPGSNVCDKEGMKEFFARHPDRAAAWARIQGIPFSEINNFIDSLNTAYLAQNVKLTMYGFRNGQEYGYEAIIAAGTAVLVDDEGLPRARCACGNPLTTEVPPDETTTTTALTTTTEPVEIEECPEGTTYYRDEEGNPVSPEPTMDEWVEIDSSETGFNPAPLDDASEQSTEEWEPTYDLCAPECPEYTPEEGEIYDDSWRYEDGRWVPLFGDYSPIYDTRLLPGWVEDCGPCPPEDPGTNDSAPPTRRYEGEYYTWDYDLEQWVDSNGVPGNLPNSDGALSDPPDINGEGLDPEFEQSLEDEFGDDYDPCEPPCPIDDYLSSLPTYFVDPAGFSWSYNSHTGEWTPSNGGAPQADPPPWIQDLLDTYLVAYDPNSPCSPPPLCPNPAGSPLSPYVVDKDGVLWTWAAGKWYSPSGESRELISEFPDCSPCPAEMDGRDIWQYYDSNNYRWLRDARGLWWRADDPSGEKYNIWEIPGYLEDCGSQECPDIGSATGALYLDPNGMIWEFDGTNWTSTTEDGSTSRISDAEKLPGCDKDEQLYAQDQPVNALIACTYNQLTDSYQMRVLLEGEVSRVHGVFDDIPPNTRYERVGNLFFRNFNERPTGVVELTINRGPTNPPVIYNHDVADCRQPLPGTEDGEFNIDLRTTCGFSSTRRQWVFEVTPLDAGRPVTDVVSVVEVANGIVYQRLGNTFSRTLDDIRIARFYVRVTLSNGSFNEILVDTGDCDDVIAAEWGRINMYAQCTWNSQLERSEIHIELYGETSKVWKVGIPRDRNLYFTRVAEPRNHWFTAVDDFPSLLNASGEVTVEVILFDNSFHYFGFTPALTASGECSSVESGDFPEGYEFGLIPSLGCSTDNNGDFVVVVGMSSVLNSRPELIVADIRKVWDSTNPNRYYAPTGMQFVGVWSPPPGPQDGTWITIKLWGGRSNEYLMTFSDCETVPILGTITSPLTSEEEQTGGVVTLDPTTTTTNPPRVVTPATTTTTLPNIDPEISNLSVSCRVVPGQSGSYTATFSITATDDNGDSLEIFVRGFDSNLNRLTVIPESAVIDSGGTATFTASFEFTNLSYTILVSDGREGFAADSGTVGSDFAPYCD